LLALDRGAAAAAEGQPPARVPGRSGRAPRAGFGIQYWGEGYTAGALAKAPHAALIIEASVMGADAGEGERLFTAAEVARIRRDGERPVYAYLNVGELEPNRDYWVEAFGGEPDPGAPGEASPAWYAGRSPSGERIAAFWTPEWAAVLERRIDAFLARGYDGIFLDDVLHYYTWSMPGVVVPARLAAREGAPKRAGDFAAAMIALVLRLAAYAREGAALHDRDFAVLVNGGAFIGWDAATEGDAAPTAQHRDFATYLGAIDGIAIESALGEPAQQATVDALRHGFGMHGIPVMAIDYLSRHPGADPAGFRAEIAERARSVGFLPYVADDERFARLDPPLLPPGPAAPTIDLAGTPH
jgi:uncharacterized protein (TIGR01370 family)